MIQCVRDAVREHVDARVDTALFHVGRKSVRDLPVAIRAHADVSFLLHRGRCGTPSRCTPDCRVRKWPGYVGAISRSRFVGVPSSGNASGFLRRLEKLFASALGSTVQFEQPYLWQTKGRVLASMTNAEVRAAVEVTNSCSRYPMRHKGVRPALMCGICGGCLLRRASLIASGHSDLEKAERYYWGDLSAGNVTASANGAVTTDRDERVALRAVLDMQGLADLAAKGDESAALRRVTSEVSDSCGTSPSDSSERLVSLIRDHAEDWRQFVSHQGNSSWVRALCGAS